MLRFLIVLLLAALALLGGGYLLQAQNVISTLPSFFLETVIFLFVATAALYRYLIKTADPADFTRLYLLSIALRLLAFGAYCVVMIKFDPHSATANVAFFLLAYFLFTALEIAFLYRRKLR